MARTAPRSGTARRGVLPGNRRDKWRIIPARAEAWCLALVGLGLGTLEHDVAQRWTGDRVQQDVRVDRVRPQRPAALPLVVAYWRFIGAEVNVDLDVEPNAVSIGVGDPAIELTVVPDCGCDACDSGSERFLSVLDDHIRGIVKGEMRRLTKGARTITVHNRDGWAASGSFARDEVARILAHPDGWDEISGVAWSTPSSDRRSPMEICPSCRTNRPDTGPDSVGPDGRS